MMLACSAVRLDRSKTSHTPPPTWIKVWPGTSIHCLSTLKVPKRCNDLLRLSQFALEPYLTCCLHIVFVPVHSWYEDGVRGSEEGKGEERRYHMAEGIGASSELSSWFYQIWHVYSRLRKVTCVGQFAHTFCIHISIVRDFIIFWISLMVSLCLQS